MFIKKKVRLNQSFLLKSTENQHWNNVLSKEVKLNFTQNKESIFEQDGEKISP